eukprot:scaffold874_cov126-Cylindrotheca_fusiformis.AAC.16
MTAVEGIESGEAEEDGFDYAFLKSMFAPTQHNSDEDDSSHQEISEYTWTSEEGVSIIYHLAFLAPGHGDSVWNSSHCIAQHLLSDRSSLSIRSWPPTSALEFGAGAALPSLVLWKESTTELFITDRKINESTFDALHMSIDKNSALWGISHEEIESRVHILPHTWGEDIERLKAKDIELLIASDCIYDPTYHSALLKSASECLSQEKGLFIVGYSFHLNVSPEKVLEFFQVATSQYRLKVVSEFKKEYEGQLGIGDDDPNRGAVYIKVLAHEDSIC